MLKLTKILSAAIASGIKERTIDNTANNSDNRDVNQQVKKDLAVIVLPKNSQTAGVFTQNIICAAPIVIAKNHLKNDIRALVINSGNANAGTGIASGDKGLENAYQICQLIADGLKIETSQVLPFSTGVIGQQLPMDCFSNNIGTLIQNINEENLNDVSNAITTTDTCHKIIAKSFVINNKKVSLSGMAKGSGMIRPDMATMLSFILTDIKISKKDLQQCLEIAVNQSFNRITVDGDTSTNDACTLSTTGLSEVSFDEAKEEFQTALNEVCLDLALKIIKDGEGATKMIKIVVKGGNSQEDCLEVAYTVAHSPLVKTAFFASDANWGRIIAAIGRSKIQNLKPENISLYLEDICLIKNGQLNSNYLEDDGARIMSQKEITVNIIIGNSQLSETIWTTDLSYDYIKINAEYRS
jgi:glutamate N-acetyltransferase/amino-acid N-acetyltransferase